MNPFSNWNHVIIYCSVHFLRYNLISYKNKHGRRIFSAMSCSNVRRVSVYRNEVQDHVKKGTRHKILCSFDCEQKKIKNKLLTTMSQEIMEGANECAYFRARTDTSVAILFHLQFSPRERYSLAIATSAAASHLAGHRSR